MKKVLHTYLLFLSIPALAQVAPPNYDFSLDNLQVFLPGGELKAAQAKYKKSTLDSKKGNTEVWKFYIAQIRYHFPVLVQVYNGKILDFYTTLPTYFLHNIFHQSLINRFKKQDSYKKINQNALYVWNNAKGNKIRYSGTCTVTCFPLYLSIATNTPAVEVGPYTSLYKKFVTNSPDK